MKVIRIYTGEDNQSHFEHLEIPLNDTRLGRMTDLLPAEGILFRETSPGLVYDFHTAPRRQFVLFLSGAAELECGDGTVRRFGAGDILLADDLTGQGHISRDVEGPRQTVFVPIPQDFDLSAWRK